MPYFDFFWTAEIETHLNANGITTDEFEEVVRHPVRQTTSRSSGRPAAWGYTRDGRHILAIYEMLDDLTVLPVTAYR